MSSLIGVYVGAVGAAGATGGVLGWVARAGRRSVRAADVIERVARLLEPDGDAPGLSERLRALEHGQIRIEAQLKPNGGASTRDAINRLEAMMETLAGRQPPAPGP